MAVALVDVWHKKTGQHTQLPEKAVPLWPDYTTDKPKGADKATPAAPTGTQQKEG